MKNAKLFLSRLRSIAWLPEGFSILAVFFSVFRLLVYAQTRVSVLDEGAYLLKGYLFAIGEYQPYQLFGLWTNQNPLAFLIPGFVQKYFGPGLAVGRYFAVLIALLLLLGLWIAARRFGGKWWAAGVLWAFVLNPYILKSYSVAISQGMTACLLIWVIVLVSDNEKQLWQIILGSALAGIMVLVRINMITVIPILWLYIIWRNGWKAGSWSVGASLVILAVGHAFYWPGILQVWTKLVPRGLFAFLDNWRVPKTYVRSWNPDVAFDNQAMSFFRTIRFHLIAFFGVFTSLLLWPRSKFWRHKDEFKTAVFLTVLFLSLLLTHMYATLTRNYCVYCLEGYLAFFSMLGLLIVILTYNAWKVPLVWWRQFLIAGLILVLSLGVGWSSFEDTGVLTSNLPIPSILVRSKLASGFVGLGEVFGNKFSLRPSEVKKLLPAIVGGAIGLTTLATAGSLKYFSKRESNTNKHSFSGLPSFAYLSTIIFSVIVLFLTPTIALGGGSTIYDCSGNTLQSYKAAGEHLARLIPPGSKVYWRGGLSVVPLLYVPGIKIFPPQVNGSYSYFIGGDPDILLKFGYWNGELARQWIHETDFILVQERYYKGKHRELIMSEPVQALEPTPPSVPCEEEARILVFKRLPYP